jgi:hypothetical protein
MCDICDALGQWICCGGVFGNDERCYGCGCTKDEDARACELYESLHPDDVAVGRYPGNDELRTFKRDHLEEVRSDG